MLYMFRTVLVHHQEQPFISCTSHLVYAGIRRYVWLLCDYSHTTARHMVSAYTKRDVQLIKLLLMMDWYSPKHVEHLMEIKSYHKNFVHLVGLYTYRRWLFLRLSTTTWCTVQWRHDIAAHILDLDMRWRHVASFILPTQRLGSYVTPTVVATQFDWRITTGVPSWNAKLAWNVLKTYLYLRR